MDLVFANINAVLMSAAVGADSGKFVVRVKSSIAFETVALERMRLRFSARGASCLWHLISDYWDTFCIVNRYMDIYLCTVHD